jgi:hypothetical protein
MRISEAILAMFPMKPISNPPSANELSAISRDSVVHLQPTVGLHSEKYVIYRSSPPPILNRMIQHGAAAIGVEEDTLRYSIRWIESKLSKVRRTSRVDPPVVRTALKSQAHEAIINGSSGGRQASEIDIPHVD